MKGLYSVAKMLVEKKGISDPGEQAFYIIALYALLCKFNSHPEIVCDVFLNAEMIIDPYMEFSELLELYDMKSKLDPNICSLVDGISDAAKTIRIRNNKIEVIDDKPLVICNAYHKFLEEVLNSYCHEMSHLIKNRINHLYYCDKGQEVECFLRSGLSIQRNIVDKETLDVCGENKNKILEEAINTVQTTEALSYIKDLNFVNVDENVKDLLEQIDYGELESDKGYQDIVLLFRILWKNDKFRKIVESNIVEGNINNVFEVFDHICDCPGALEKISEIFDKLDEIYENDSISFNRIILTKQYKRIANKFLKNVS